MRPAGISCYIRPRAGTGTLNRCDVLDLLRWDALPVLGADIEARAEADTVLVGSNDVAGSEQAKGSGS